MRRNRGLASVLLLVGCAGGVDEARFGTQQDPPGAKPVVAAPTPLPEETGTTGWTELQPSSDTRIVYVSSSSGSESNDGLSEAKPKKRLASGKALLRNGYPDWLLLKRGDTFDEDFGNGWGLSGRSEEERMLVSAYGSGARPLLKTGNHNGFAAFDGTRNDHLAIVGIHFWANGYGGRNGSPRGIGVFGAVKNFLVEDCYLQAFETNLVFQGTPEKVGRHQNIAIRRCIVVDAYNTGTSNSEGIYAAGTDGLRIEECVFDRNGWRTDVAGSGPTWFRRNLYIQNGNTKVLVRGNIVASTDGMQVRCGGTVTDNLLLRNAIGILIGGGDDPEPEGVTGVVRRNVILDGNDLQAGSERGWGMNFENVKQAAVESNVIAHNTTGRAPFSVTFGFARTGAGVRDLLFSKNVVFDWNGPVRFLGSPSQTLGLQFVGNRIQEPGSREPLVLVGDLGIASGIRSADNLLHSGKPESEWLRSGERSQSMKEWMDRLKDTTSAARKAEFPDPARDIGAYHASISGPPSLEAFLLEARKQSKENWREAYTAEAVNRFVRAGFGL